MSLLRMPYLVSMGIFVTFAVANCTGGKSKSDENGGEGGGGSGGSDEGGGGGSPKGGNGGSAAGGKGAVGGGSAGKGGAEQSGGTAGIPGGSGGSPMAGMGGASSSMCTPLSAIAGKMDPEINPNLTFCEPTCIYRPNWPGHHTCGPDGSVYKPVAMKTSGFCGEANNQDGVMTFPRGRVEAAAFSFATKPSGFVNNPATGVSKAYLVGGTEEYAKAKDGEVAVTFWMSGFSNDGAHGISNIHEYLYSRGELPYTIAVFLDGGDGKLFAEKDFSKRMASLKNTVLPALLAKWPKISKNPNYRSLAGQSTAGAEAFDAAWLYTDIIAKGIAGSASLACFTCLGGQGSTAENCHEDLAECAAKNKIKNNTYAKEVMFCPARPIRWTTTVGTCDIWGLRHERLAQKNPSCSDTSDPGSLDESSCKASWPVVNQDLADALKAKGVPFQLIKFVGGTHAPSDWSAALPIQIRWAFKDITCKM